jgi:hypothetical protein
MLTQAVLSSSGEELSGLQVKHVVAGNAWQQSIIKADS